jgi:hypothetical protein
VRSHARNRLYDEAVRRALTVLWEAADRVEPVLNFGAPVKTGRML